MSLDGFPCEFGHRRTSSLGFVTESSVEIVWELDGGPLHVCQHTLTVGRGKVFCAMSAWRPVAGRVEPSCDSGVVGFSGPGRKMEQSVRSQL